MKLQQEGKWEEAKALYCEILESEVMEVGGVLNGAPPSGTILRLQFLIYKNIASIARGQGDLSAATDAYIQVRRLIRSVYHCIKMAAIAMTTTGCFFLPTGYLCG